ncbi:MAG: hypothetical protein RML45_08335 [Acetobacteraceae bacterium]|nr:hypothetical protein [Acetobacteraceae bacterium]
MADDGEVMADEDDCQGKLPAQSQEEVHDLCLDGHVERCDRFVADEDVRPHGERPGDGDPLPLSARKLVGERSATSAARPTRSSHSATKRRACGFVMSLCAIGPSAIWSPTSHAGIERRQRILEDDLDSRRALAWTA